MRQFLWGLFTKMVIANNLAPFTNEIFNNSENMNGSAILLGAIFYTVQIYADFAGYSNMACGVSKLFNIRITNNFSFPFFSTNISDFWKKWHISLTSWMMDYVFTPLNFLLRKQKKPGIILSVFVTFLLVGLWHGANWTFVVFGIIQGLLFIPVILNGSMAKSTSVGQSGNLPTLREGLSMAGLFLLISLTTILFRAENIQHTWSCFTKLFSSSLFSLPTVRPWTSVILIALFFVVEWLGRNSAYSFEQVGNKFKKPIRYAIYYAMAASIFWFGGAAEQFIYFQF
jgi:alginate O-acetyltransferase complex protein AlgI